MPPRRRRGRVRRRRCGEARSYSPVTPLNEESAQFVIKQARANEEEYECKHGGQGGPPCKFGMSELACMAPSRAARESTVVSWSRDPSADNPRDRRRGAADCPRTIRGTAAAPPRPVRGQSAEPPAPAQPVRGQIRGAAATPPRPARGQSVGQLRRRRDPSADNPRGRRGAAAPIHQDAHAGWAPSSFSPSSRTRAARIIRPTTSISRISRSSQETDRTRGRAESPVSDDPPPRNIHVPAAASPRPASTQVHYQLHRPGRLAHRDQHRANAARRPLSFSLDDPRPRRPRRRPGSNEGSAAPPVGRSASPAARRD